MTTKVSLTGAWVLVETAPVRMLAQAHGDVDVALATSLPAAGAPGYRVLNGDFSDFAAISDFGGTTNFYAKAAGNSASLLYDVA